MTVPIDMTAILDWLRATAPAAQLSSDSRSIGQGDVFFAYPGDAGDGRRYIPQAMERGAKAIVHEADNFEWNDQWAVPHLPVQALRQWAGPLANAWYGQPDVAMHTVAVTGTNGKTSCSQWLGKALSLLNEPCAVIGTLGVGMYRHGIHDDFEVTGYTTPDAVLLQRKLVGLREAGAQALAIEASSIGLHQGRMNGMHVDTAVFTNFTRDHLDYHGDMLSYEMAKTMLFDWVGLKNAVINLDDPMGLRLVLHVQEFHPEVRVLGYTTIGRKVYGVETLSASEIRFPHGATAFQLESPFGAMQVKTQLIGQFNVSNVLAILGVLLAKDFSLKAAVDAVASLNPVPGRMEQVSGPDTPLVVIDYAHTPDALEQAIGVLHQVAEQRGGQLWCVFGCGGDRDPGKRPQMGVAAEAADHVILTTDNPRSEEPAAINAQIIAGMKNTPQVIEDRAAAILWAIRHAAKADVVLLAGKGHETYQEIKGKKLPFLDADHAALALAARATMKGTN